MKKIVLPLMLIAAFAVAAFAADKPVEKTFAATVNAQGVQVVDMTGGDYYFDPNHVIVKVNVPVEIHIKKASGFVPHNMLMDSPDAGMKFSEAISEAGSVIKFTPTKTGTFPFYCDKKLLFFESHREKGMEGKMEVVQ